jgi:regulatory protein
MARAKTTPLDREALMNYALRTLGMRGLSVSEIRARLQRRAADGADVDLVIAALKDAGYVNDRRFAESYAAARRENQGFGRMRVLRDLRGRKVAADVAGGAVDQAFACADETEMIEQFLARKYRGKDLAAVLAEDKGMISAYRRLRLAGFAAGPSIRVLKRYSSSAEGLEESEPDEEA